LDHPGTTTSLIVCFWTLAKDSEGKNEGHLIGVKEKIVGTEDDITMKGIVCITILMWMLG
jgi:hypothetical protein